MVFKKESEVHVVAGVVRDEEKNDASSASLSDETAGEGQDAATLDIGRFIKSHSIILFGVVMMASWEVFVLTIQLALVNGGPANLFWGSLIAAPGITAVGFSLAELASIDPNVGAQYRWSANLAPVAPRFFGLIQGWLTVFAWTFCVAGGASVASNVVTTLITFNSDTFVLENWHTTLIMIALLSVALIGNIYFRFILDYLEIFGGVLHIVLFVVFIAVLAALGPRNDAEYVFTTIVTQGGWESRGMSFVVGLLPITTALLGPDSILHMSDEVENVHTQAPRSMVVACASNAIMVVIFVLVILFFCGPIDGLADSDMPIIPLMYRVTGSRPATNVLVAVLGVMMFASCFNSMASVSRLVYAFASDKGLPYSGWFTYVHPTLHVPTHALFAIMAVCVALSLIYIGSTEAFNAILSLGTMGMTLSYVLPILFMLLRKVRPGVPRPPYGSLRMGRVKGVVCNVFSVCYVVFVSVWMPFPSELPVTAANMNYAGPIYILALLLALADWFVSGHKRFQMPVKRYE